MENGNASASLLYFILGPIICLFDDRLPQLRQDINRGFVFSRCLLQNIFLKEVLSVTQSLKLSHNGLLYFLQGNVPLRHQLNAKRLFMSFRRSAFIMSLIGPMLYFALFYKHNSLKYGKVEMHQSLYMNQCALKSAKKSFYKSTNTICFNNFGIITFVLFLEHCVNASRMR